MQLQMSFVLLHSDGGAWLLAGGKQQNALKCLNPRWCKRYTL